VCDWVFDDQPVGLQTSHGNVLAIPYSVDLNDVPAMAIHRQSPRQYRQSICDAFEQLYAEASTSARVLTHVLHPCICAAAHRMRYLEQDFAHNKRDDVVVWTGDQVLDWYRAIQR
jgi:allantoinase